MTIRGSSFDIDGCLFNDAYFLLQEKDVIAANRNLLDGIKSSNASYRKNIVFVGSNRQSKGVDEVNAVRNGSGSCFPAIQKVSEYLEGTLDTFLLADLYGDLPDGTSFTRALDPSVANHAPWLFDETKVTILYAQMHKLAKDVKQEKPDEEEAIIFNFYDDRSAFPDRRREDILEWICRFYARSPDLIPKNMTLRLHYYVGQGMGKKLFEIQGTGIIDGNYRQTVKEMAGQTIRVTVLKVAHGVNPSLLTQRVPFIPAVAPELIPIPVPIPVPIPIPIPVAREHEPTNSSHLVAQPDTDLMRQEPVPRMVSRKEQLLNQQLLIIREKSNDLKGHDGAYRAAIALHASITDIALRYFEGAIDKHVFKERCTIDIKNARLVLEMHRGWAELLGNLAICIVTVGVGVLIKGIINVAQNKRFLFLCNTDSANKLNALEETIARIVPAP